MGENGHLAFNDPPVADFADPRDVKVVELEAACRRQQVNEGHFPGLDDVPAQAITVTIPALLRAGRVLAVVPEARKAEPVRGRADGAHHHGVPGLGAADDLPRHRPPRARLGAPPPGLTGAPIRGVSRVSERPLPSDVVKVMDWVVEQVAAEARDAEAGAVAAPARTEPLLALDAVEGIGQSGGGVPQLARHDGRSWAR